MAPSPSIVEVATDKIIGLQLRKENKAILEQLNKIKEKREADRAESAKKFKAGEEKIAALELKIEEMGQEQRKSEQAREKHRAEQSANIAKLRQQMQTFLEQRGDFSKEDIGEIMHAKVPSNSLRARDPHSPAPENHSQSTSKDSSRRQGIAVPRVSDEDLQMNGLLQFSRHSAASKSKDAPAAKRPNTRSRGHSGEILAAPAPSITSPGASIRLVQATGSFRDYFDQSTDLFKSLNLTKGQEPEIDLVNAFITGITNQKARDKFLEHMQQSHMAKMRKGEIHIICGWEDVEEGLRKTGLLGATESSSDAGKNRQNVNPRGGLETSFHR